MPYDKEKILNSKLAYKVLRYIWDQEEGSYTSEIAEELGSSSTSISNVIKQLRELGLIERGKRTKAQYYEFSEGGLISFIKNFWSNKYETLMKDGGIYIGGEDDEDMAPEEYLDDLEPLSKSIYENYIDGYLTKYENSTIKSMIYDDFQAELQNMVRLVKNTDEAPVDEDQAYLRSEIYRSLEFNTNAIIFSNLKDEIDIEDND